MRDPSAHAGAGRQRDWSLRQGAGLHSDAATDLRRRKLILACQRIGDVPNKVGDWMALGVVAHGLEVDVPRASNDHAPLAQVVDGDDESVICHPLNGAPIPPQCRLDTVADVRSQLVPLRS